MGKGKNEEQAEKGHRQRLELRMVKQEFDLSQSYQAASRTELAEPGCELFRHRAVVSCRI
jgi:hypothetical protein